MRIECNADNASKLAWTTPCLEEVGTIEDVKGPGAQGALDGIFEPDDPAS